MMHLLYEAVSPTPSVLVFLQLHKVKFAKWLKDILDIMLSDIEMNIADV